ncbi:MAG: sporulation peptidase YabG [Bacilli bacterium]|nr:sporulation peptidase YabG [Bacilli bacterium]MDD4733458.1 sporulation peptidase YabG [Bacilli bacterium]
MKYKIGDLVTRNSYLNDIVFEITEIDEENEICYLKGCTVRLYADAMVDDLKLYEEKIDEKEFIEKSRVNIPADRDNYFYLPGKILHIDGDNDYLQKCLSYYNKCNLKAIGKLETEDQVANNMRDWLEEYNPNIVVITGHDAYYKKKGDINNNSAYKNSINFINSINEARRYEKSQEKLIIIAGACQSNYEELIKAGANFASSPKRINIHALDPAILAANMALTDISKDIDLKVLLDNTKYGISGIGGIKTKGTMYIGYPR